MTERDLHLGWSTFGDVPDTYVVLATCEDEQTQIFLTNPTPALARAYLVSAEQAMHGTAYTALIREHEANCYRCEGSPKRVIWEGPDLISEGRLH